MWIGHDPLAETPRGVLERETPAGFAPLALHVTDRFGNHGTTEL